MFPRGADGQEIVVPALEASHVAASRFSLQNGQLISGVRLSGHVHSTAALSEPERRVRSRRSRLAVRLTPGVRRAHQQYGVVFPMEFEVP